MGAAAAPVQWTHARQHGPPPALLAGYVHAARNPWEYSTSPALQAEQPCKSSETTHRGPTTAQPATGGEHCFDYATLMCMEMLRRHKPPRQALNSCYPNRLSNSPCPRALLSWRPTAWAPEAAMPVPKDHSSAAVAPEQSNTRIHSPTMRTQSTLWCGTIQWRHALLVKRPSLHASHMGARPALAQHLRCTCEAAASAAPCTQRNCRYACPAARLLPWAADCAHAQLLRGPPAM